MTRINVGISPKELPDKLLLAEHRELKRIPNTIISGRAKIEDIPKTFRLGKGHVKFFYDKIKYLDRRNTALYLECFNRGFNVKWYGGVYYDILKEHPNLYNDWEPRRRDRNLIVDRIESKGFNLLKKI